MLDVELWIQNALAICKYQKIWRKNPGEIAFKRLDPHTQKLALGDKPSRIAQTNGDICKSDKGDCGKHIRQHRRVRFKKCANMALGWRYTTHGVVLDTIHALRHLV